ncbi:MAG: glycosyltransferase family 2 protein [Muribaculaceae bacterium]|nr:glycosyltransferase family 2 protein [Muribaculaceae bacterium]
MSLLTIFTPTYNRAHTLGRVYESLCRQTCGDFEWLVVDDGSTDHTSELVQKWITEGKLRIRYIHQPNGGLHTGYNTAYANIDTELNVCIDSDDHMPDDAVEIIAREWSRRGSDDYAGLIGLDYDVRTALPIGGPFPEWMTECYFLDLYTKKLHIGDTKPVMRTELMRKVAPQIGYEGEKNFNPVYMLLQVCDEYPLLVVNANLCNVEYQSGDSMSGNIINQYFNSPRSFSKMRKLEMTLRRSGPKNRARVTAHYIATSIIARNRRFVQESPRKALTLAMLPVGVMLYFYLRYKKDGTR